MPLWDVATRGTWLVQSQVDAPTPEEAVAQASDIAERQLLAVTPQITTVVGWAVAVAAEAEAC